LLESNKPTNVFKQAPCWHELVYDSKSFIPEPTVICLASSLPGNTGWLARRASADEIGLSEFGSVDMFDISHAFYIWPVMRENALAVGIDFYLPDAAPTGSLKPQVKSSDTGEKTQEGIR
jgi:hypothetical protein